MLIIFYADYTDSLLEIILYLDSSMGQYGWAQRNIFKIKVLRRLENAISRLVFANTVNASINYKLFQLLCKHSVVFNSSKVS